VTEATAAQRDAPGATAGAGVAGSSARLEALDALRGLAALTVVLNHSLHVFPGFALRPWWGSTQAGAGLAVYLVNHTPLGVLVDGNAAVQLFFVLSGLVLARLVLAPRPPAYRVFALKRVLRLYPPYVVAVAVAWIGQAAFGAHVAVGPTQWVTDEWREHLSLSTAAAYALMLPWHTGLDGPVWSLGHEMRVSLLLPLLLLPARIWGLWGAVALSLVCLGVGSFTVEHLQISDWSEVTVMLAKTALYAGLFGLGAILQLVSPWLVRPVPPVVPVVTVLTGLMVIWLNWHAAPCGVGAALVIAAAVMPGPVRSGLLRPVPRFLGRISYSLYLVHVPLILAVLSLTRGLLPDGMVMPLVPVMAIAVAALFYRLVEAPSHRWARAVR